jgi:hypothetical protein
MPKGMNEDTEEKFKNLFSVQEHEDLPPKVYEMFLRVKKHHDRLGAGPIEPGIIAVIAALAEMSEPLEVSMEHELTPHPVIDSVA